MRAARSFDKPKRHLFFDRGELRQFLRFALVACPDSRPTMPRASGPHALPTSVLRREKLSPVSTACCPVSAPRRSLHITGYDKRSAERIKGKARRQRYAPIMKPILHLSEVTMKKLWVLSVLFIAPSVSGCGCELILYTYLEPSTLTLEVGETAPFPQASHSGCGEPRHPVEIDTWKSDDPTIASVDADALVIAGVAPGETRLNAFTLERSIDTGENYLSSFKGLTVTVIVPNSANWLP